MRAADGMTALARVPGAAAAVAAAIGLVWASTVPMTLHDSPDAVLRLAWSARPERVQTCRRPSDEELAAVPRHMRQELVCEGITAEYRLQVERDGEVLADRIVRGGGLRRDRRLYVFHELSVPAGETRLDVRFDRIAPDQPPAAAQAGRAGSSSEGPSAATGVASPAGTAHDMTAIRRSDREAVPPHLRWERRVSLRAREVVLVTYDPDRRALVALPDASDNGRSSQRH